jgi:hypothetical protein
MAGSMTLTPGQQIVVGVLTRMEKYLLLAIPLTLSRASVPDTQLRAARALRERRRPFSSPIWRRSRKR